MQINEKIKNFNKYQKILCVLLVIILILAVISIISMNKKPKSLEKYIKSHPSTQREIENLNKGDVQMTVEKNTIIYKYDTRYWEIRTSTILQKIACKNLSRARKLRKIASYRFQISKTRQE